MKTNVYIFATLVLWGIIPIFDKLGLGDKKISPFLGLSMRLLSACAIFIPILLADSRFRTGLFELSTQAKLTFALSGICSVIISQYLYYTALQDEKVTKLFPVLFGGAPVVTMILAKIILGEQMKLHSIIGGLLIVIGSAIMFSG